MFIILSISSVFQWRLVLTAAIPWWRLPSRRLKLRSATCPSDPKWLSTCPIERTLTTPAWQNRRRKIAPSELFCPRRVTGEDIALPLVSTVGVRYKALPLVSTVGPRYKAPPLVSTVGLRYKAPPLVSTVGPIYKAPPLVSTVGPRYEAPPLVSTKLSLVPLVSI